MTALIVCNRFFLVGNAMLPLKDVPMKKEIKNGYL